MMMIPQGVFQNNIVSIHGDKGQQWLDNLSAFIAELKERWGLSELNPLHHLTYHYIASTTREEGQGAILKLGVPCSELNNEIRFLEYYDGQGTVPVLASDPALGALLLQKLVPGESLRAYRDDWHATRIAGGVISKLLKPVDNEYPFPHLADWFERLQKLKTRFHGKISPFPQGVISKTETLARELIQSMDTEVLLHGDLHHGNILSCGTDDFIAIDPKGVIGEPAFETACFLYNPIPGLLRTSSPLNVIRNRIDIFNDIVHFDRERMLIWAFCKTVLSAWWEIEDKGKDVDYFTACAHEFDRLVK